MYVTWALRWRVRSELGSINLNSDSDNADSSSTTTTISTSVNERRLFIDRELQVWENKLQIPDVASSFENRWAGKTL